MASRGINKVILIGNMGSDPEVRYMPDGTPVANISLATSDVWKDKNTGEKRERTEWHRVAFFGGVVDILQRYCKKGSKLYVEGKLQTRKWQAQDGTDRYTTQVIVGVGGVMQILGSSRNSPDAPPDHDGQQGGHQGGQRESAGARGYRQASGGGGTRGAASQAHQAPAAAGPNTDFDDDIPF